MISDEKTEAKRFWGDSLSFQGTALGLEPRTLNTEVNVFPQPLGSFGQGWLKAVDTHSRAWLRIRFRFGPQTTKADASYWGHRADSPSPASHSCLPSGSPTSPPSYSANSHSSFKTRLLLPSLLRGFRASLFCPYMSIYSNQSPSHSDIFQMSTSLTGLELQDEGLRLIYLFITSSQQCWTHTQSQMNASQKSPFLFKGKI